MLKYLILTLAFMCAFNIAAHADSTMFPQPTANKGGAGLGIGALIGGLIGGPIGAVVGAAGGTWIGNRETRNDVEVAVLEQRLADREQELAELKLAFAESGNEPVDDFQPVRLEYPRSAMEQLSRGVSLSVYFRTASAEMESEFRPRVERLAHYLNMFPEIRLLLEAHADRRGLSNYNRLLSEQRARAVQRSLIRAGVAPERIRTSVYGESQALAAEGDDEGYVFDRRVDIQLTLGAEA